MFLGALFVCLSFSFHKNSKSNEQKFFVGIGPEQKKK